MERLFSPTGSYGSVSEMVDNNQFYFDEFYGVPTDTMSAKGTVLSDLRDQSFTKIIMGAPLADFDKFVADWKKLGGDQVTTEVNAWYKAKKQ